MGGLRPPSFKNSQILITMTPANRHYELIASRFDWKLSEEKTIHAWGFNKQVPGPVIKANKGDNLSITVKNELDEPTLIHWHGIRLPSSMDGTGEVQKPIQPGESFTYHFIVPDAGTFWYHSHQNETEQMEKGMYGALIVEEQTDLVVDEERVLMIDDMKLNKNNDFKRGGFLSRWIERHDGREGETALMNGKENYSFEVHAGQVERWRLINASSARYFLLSLEGKSFNLIGTDGGLIEKPQTLTQLLLTPGERADILVGPFTEGETITIQSLPYNRMTFVKSTRTTFATVKVAGSKSSRYFLPEVLNEIRSLASKNAEVTRKVKLSVGPSLKHGIDFLINNKVHYTDKHVNMHELQIWELHNSSLMDHPFHLHGFFFQVLEENGKVPAYTSWKDTVNLKPRSKVKIAWMPDRPGTWMYHCHILEHHEAGMVANFEILEAGKKESLTSHHHHACTM